VVKNHVFSLGDCVVKNLAELQAECAALGINVETKGRASKVPYIAALRDYHWQKGHPGEPMPAQIMPMLLGSWEDLEKEEARQIEQDHHAWIVQPKMDGIRALFHIQGDRVRITSRTVSEVTYRLSEFQDNLPHLATDLAGLGGTILDGELVFPRSRLDTGSTVTENSLQATMAVLAASPIKARQFQSGQHAYVYFHAFDILRSCGQDVTPLPLIERQDVLAKTLRRQKNEFIEEVPCFAVNKPDIHRRIIDAGGEGTVWKKAASPYEPGRRVGHWIKRKRGMALQAFVTGFKTGTNGHSGKVGGLEFSTQNPDGTCHVAAWVTGWTDVERDSMTLSMADGTVALNPQYHRRRARIEGQDVSARSRRLRHARLLSWLPVAALLGVGSSPGRLPWTSKTASNR